MYNLTLANIVSEIQQDIITLIGIDLRLAPKFLRLAFHDAISLHCLNISDPENRGLAYPIAALQPIVNNYQEYLSEADVWVLAALVACEATSDAAFPMYYYGRDPSETCIPRPFPSADLTTHSLLQYFEDTFDFSTRETVVVMGAHTIGVMQRNQSGFQGAWVDGRHVLDNEYYALLVGGRPSSSLDKKLDLAPFWSREYLNNVEFPNIPNRFLWTRRSDAGGDSSQGDLTGDNDERLGMTNADIALVRDLSSAQDDQFRVKCDFGLREEIHSPHGRCPAAKVTIDLVAELKVNNTQWLMEFEYVLRKMFTYGYDMTSGCDEGKCLKLVDPNLIPKETKAPTPSPTTGSTVIQTFIPSTTPTMRRKPSNLSLTTLTLSTSAITFLSILAVYVLFKRRKERHGSGQLMENSEFDNENGEIGGISKNRHEDDFEQHPQQCALGSLPVEFHE